MYRNEDTIVALATPRGKGALAIVRLSGPEAIALVNRCFRGKNLEEAPSHTAHVGYLTDAGGTVLDQVVVTIFRTPRSFTGEDVAEITCHGGDLAPQLILRTLLQQGARLAEPGEFTLRAFLNGKMDLTQAEAVADLIHARSTLAHRLSLHQLQGAYGDILQRIRQELLQLTALVELELDFAEEDVTFADRQELLQLVDEALAQIHRLLSTHRLNTLLRDGVEVVIGGRPNAGKSTLLNALVERDRAIVSDIPGTTRDVIEDEVEIGGLLFRFVDTAGLRETADRIEAEGVRRSEAAIRRADILLYVFDLTLGLDAEEQAFLERLRSDHPMLHILLVGNKADRVNTPTAPPMPLPFMALSARAACAHPEVLQPLRTWLEETVTEALSVMDASPVVVNQRHARHLQLAREALLRVRSGVEGGISGDLLALDLRVALDELGAITGEITTEDVLDTIFSQFCIGK